MKPVETVRRIAHRDQVKRSKGLKYHLAKVRVAGSNPVVRSTEPLLTDGGQGFFLLSAWNAWNMRTVHVSKLPSGSWRVIVQIGGQRLSATAPTKDLAKLAGAKLMVDAGQLPDKNDATMRELLLLHLDEHPYKATSLADFRSVLKLIPDQFLDRHVQAVSPAVLDAVYSKMLRAEVSAYRVRKAHTLISSALTRARRWGWISTNPARDAEPPSEPTPEVYSPDTETARKFIAAADQVSATFGLFLRISALTGARRGEVCGLQWRDLSAGELRIRRAVSYTKESGLVVDEVKTGKKGVRVIALHPVLIEALKDHRLVQRTAALAAGQPFTDRSFLFSKDHVHPWHPTSATHLAYEARDNAGLIEAVKMKDLRNYVVTEMLTEGYSLKQAGGRVGHARVSTTADRYAAFVPASDRDAAMMLGDKLFGPGSSAVS